MPDHRGRVCALLRGKGLSPFHSDNRGSDESAEDQSQADSQSPWEREGRERTIFAQAGIVAVDSRAHPAAWRACRSPKHAASTKEAS